MPLLDKDPSAEFFFLRVFVVALAVAVACWFSTASLVALASQRRRCCPREVCGQEGTRRKLAPTRILYSDSYQRISMANHLRPDTARNVVLGGLLAAVGGAEANHGIAVAAGSKALRSPGAKTAGSTPNRSKIS